MRRSAISALILILVYPYSAFSQGDSESGDEQYLEAMAVEHDGDTPVATALVVPGATPVEATISVDTPAYAQINGAPVEGFLASPADTEETGAGVILIHEWWGLNDNVREVARILARAGYTALAVDLYGGKTGSDADSARSLATEAGSNPEAVLDNLSQAYDFLKTRTGDDGRVATLGWCFGGGWSLRGGMHLGDKLDAVVIYYGKLVNDKHRLSSLRAPVLGIFGGQDRGIPIGSVSVFEADMSTLGRRAEVHVFPDAGHAFANPSGTRYRKEDAEQAWQITMRFLDEQLRAEKATEETGEKIDQERKIFLNRDLN